jgi:hypothetical protein
VTEKRQPSFIPFPGVAGMVAVLLCFPNWRPFFWIPLVIDPSCLVFIYVSPKLVREIWDHSNINLVARYTAQVSDRRKAILSFYRKDFIIKHEIYRPPGEYGLIGSSDIGTWQDTPNNMVLFMEANRLVFNKDNGDLHLAEGSVLYADNPDLLLENVVFNRV